MIVDWHAHIYTPEEAADDKGAWDGNDGPRWGNGGCPMVLENFLKAHRVFRFAGNCIVKVCNVGLMMLGVV